MGKVIDFRRGRRVGDMVTSKHPMPRGRPEMVLDASTGLYAVVLDGVVVYDELDPVGEREKIRKAASKAREPKP